VKTATGVVELRARGMPLGLMPGMDYEEHETVLEAGDAVLLHSDGIAEAHGPDREMFGFPRLKQVVGAGPGGQELIDRVIAELETFIGRDAEQEDDITMVTLQRSTGAAMIVPAMNGAVLDEFDLPSEPGNERRAIDRVERAVRDLGIETARLERLKTAVGEATMNAMEHGNEYRADRPVSIRVLRETDSVRVLVTDRGGAAELPAHDDPDLEAKLAGRERPRCWGLFLIEKMVDEAHVTGGAETRTLELVLRLRGGDDGGT
jgi:anti-sigma regulatory factor (Ser/Thr protein kinase)